MDQSSGVYTNRRNAQHAPAGACDGAVTAQPGPRHYADLMDSTDVGRLLIVAGILVAVVGGFLALGRRLPFGSLPGDLSFKGSNVSVSIPIVSCIAVSVVLTVLLNIFLRR